MSLSPECLSALKSAHDREKSLAKVGEIIGYSSSAVSQLLSGTYQAKSMSKIEAAIRARLMAETVICPELDVISLEKCMDWRVRAKIQMPTTHQAVRMYRACRVCPQGQNERLNGGKNA